MRLTNHYGLVKTALLGLPFALAFTLSACDDSGSNADNNGGNGGEGGSSVSTTCDFKFEEDAWSYSYLGKEDEPTTVTYENLGDKLKVTEVEDIGRSCEEFVESPSDFPDMVSSTCNGNVITTISEMPFEGVVDYNYETQVATPAKSAEEAFNIVHKWCEEAKAEAAERAEYKANYNDDYWECDYTVDDDTWKIVSGRAKKVDGKWELIKEGAWFARTYIWKDGVNTEIIDEWPYNVDNMGNLTDSPEYCAEAVKSRQERIEMGEPDADIEYIYYGERLENEMKYKLVEEHCEGQVLVSKFTLISESPTREVAFNNWYTVCRDKKK
jgi:hypothetical protein